MTKTYVVLCGGVGGSKLADGLARILPPEQLTIVVNTGDDFSHLGLKICPDIDTVTYMLSGLVHPERGWGRVDETWSCMEVLGVLGGETWFQLGDKDLALHLYRTQRLKEGSSLSSVTADICSKLGVGHALVPMSEQAVNTIVSSDIGELSFQDYFVRHKCAPRVNGIRYQGVESARPSDGLLSALEAKDLAGIILAPSNPILSIEPILALAGLREIISRRNVPVVAVSPLIAGKAIKGPAGKLMEELQYEPGNAGIAAFYGSLLSGLIIDKVDRRFLHPESLQLRTDDIMMRNAQDRERVARGCLEFLNGLAAS